MQQRPNVNSAARLNYAQLKEQEQINKERMRQEEFKAEKQQQLIQKQRSQYEHVQSHGYGPGSNPQAAPRNGPQDDVEIKVFIRECDPDAQAFRVMESQALGGKAQLNATPEKPPVLFGRRASANGEQQRGSQPSSAASSSRGEVPKYLVKRKAEMEAEKDAIRAEMERQKEVAQYPPGHRPVSEAERAAILDKLAARRKELEGELGKLPMRFDTNALKLKRQQIETEMAEVEAAQQKFSVKKQLFVPI